MLQKCYNTELWEGSFKTSWDALQITSNYKWFTHISNQVPGVCLLKASNPPRFIKLSAVFIYFSFSTQKVKIVVDPCAFELCRPKSGDFRDFRVFILRPIPKNKSSEITEILQKRHNTVIWERSFKNSWNAVQMTSFSKWFSHIAIHVSYLCLLRASDPSRFIKLSFCFSCLFQF